MTLSYCLGSTSVFVILEEKAVILDKSKPTTVSRGRFGLSGSNPPWKISEVSIY